MATRSGCTAIELNIETPGVGRPRPARNERGEGRGEGKSNKNATPLPGPLLLLRRKRGRRAQSTPLIQCRRGQGEGWRRSAAHGSGQRGGEGESLAAVSPILS